MKTIDPLHLEALYATGRSIDLIDVRSQNEFEHLHALGARSVPLPELHRSEFFRKCRLASAEPLYIISRRNELARRAAEELAAVGFEEAIVVSGGIEEWEHVDLPVVRDGSSPSALRFCLILALAVAFIIALVATEFLIAMPLLLALGIITLGVMDSHIARPELANQTLAGPQADVQSSSEALVNGLDVMPRWLNGKNVSRYTP